MIYLQQRKYPEHIDKNSKRLYWGTPIAHPALMIKTDILKKYRYSITTFSNEDIDLWFRLLSDGYVIENIPEPLVNFRITDNTFKRRNYKKALYELKVYLTNLIKLHGFSLLLLYPLMRFISRLLPMYMMKKIYFSKARIRMLNAGCSELHIIKRF